MECGGEDPLVSPGTIVAEAPVPPPSGDLPVFCGVTTPLAGGAAPPPPPLKSLSHIGIFVFHFGPNTNYYTRMKNKVGGGIYEAMAMAFS